MHRRQCSARRVTVSAAGAHRAAPTAAPEISTSTEGNVAGYQSALHLKQGHADDETCATPTAAKWQGLRRGGVGRRRRRVRRGSTIDTAQPFDVVTSVDSLSTGCASCSASRAARSSPSTTTAPATRRCAACRLARWAWHREVDEVGLDARRLAVVAAGRLAVAERPIVLERLRHDATFTLSNLKVPSTSPGRRRRRHRRRRRRRARRRRRRAARRRAHPFVRPYIRVVRCRVRRRAPAATTTAPAAAITAAASATRRRHRRRRRRRRPPRRRLQAPASC